MKFIELAEKRYSVRKYDSRPIERAVLDRCIEAARLAPSAVNAQPWHFVVADEPETVRVLGRAASPSSTMNRFAHQAPVIAAVVVEKPNLISQVGGFLKNRPFYLVDIGIAAEHFCLQAAEEGVGTCIIGWFDERSVRKTLNIPSSKRVALLITLGYSDVAEPGPAERTKTSRKNRKSTGEMSSYNTYTKV